MKTFLQGGIFLLIFSVTVTFAQQNYYLKRFTTENGLPNNKIRSIAQDKTGFLWIGSWDGLSRFDGYEFKNYYHVPGDSNSLPYFSILEICVDKLNNVWVSTEVRGLCLYDRAKEQFKTFYFKGQENLGQGIYDITVDHQQNFWVNCGDGLYKFNYLNQTFDKYAQGQNQNEFANFNHRINFDEDGALWFLGERLLKCTVDEKSKTFHPQAYYKIQNNRSLPYRPHFKNAFHSIHTGTDGTRWFLSEEGIFRLDSLNNEFLPFIGDPDKITIPYPFAFVGNDKETGLNYFYGKNTLLKIPEIDSRQPSSILIDNNYSLWYGQVSESGAGTGLVRLVRTPGIFWHPLKNEADPGKPFSVFSVLKDKYGNVWTNSVGYNYIFKVENNGKVNKYNQLNPEEFYLARNVRSMLEDSTGIWLGYNDNLLMRYNFQNQQFSKVLLNRSKGIEKDTPQTMHSLVPGEKDRLVIASFGLFQYNPFDKSLKKVFNSDMFNRIYYITKDKDQYWIGKSTHQLLLLDKNFKLKKSYFLSRDKFNIEHICIGDNDDIWVATLGGGVIRLDRNTEKTEFLTTAKGLANNTTYSILKDKSGNLWIGTDHGISRYNPQAGKFRNYGLTDGLEIEEFNSDAVFQAKDGEMFFGGMGGIVRFYPDSLNQLEARDYKSNLVFTDFKVSGKTRLFAKPVYDCDTVVLSKGDNNFTTTFSALNLKDPDKVKYRHQMANYDHGWIETDFRHRSVTYSNLKPGSYNIKIEASNIPGDWVYSRTLVIVIPPYFYQTAIFKVLLLLCILGIITSAVLLYLRQINLTNKNIQNQLKLESLRGQMNPHFIFNSLNSINYFISQNDRLSANRYIADFANLIRSILSNMSAEFIPLSKEIESLQDYLNLEHLRFGDKFNYSLSIDPAINMDTTQVFPGMVQPFIENSLWHGVRALQGRTGQITVSFRQTHINTLQCIVEDDGIGRKMAAAGNNSTNGRSRGIRIVNERLKIYNSVNNTSLQVFIEDCYPEKEETGTRVTIEIPAKEAVN